MADDSINLDVKESGGEDATLSCTTCSSERRAIVAGLSRNDVLVLPEVFNKAKYTGPTP